MDLDFERLADQAEARSMAFTDMDVSKGGRSFDGYAAVYGQEFDAGQFVETMLPPALRTGLAASPNVPMLWHHNQTLPPFATRGAGTLQLEEDKRGLRVRADIDERHLLGPTLISMVERGEVRGMSVGFVAGRSNQKLSQRNGRIYRSITGFKQLLDVSPTWELAYEGTSAELRSLTEAFQQVPELVPEQVHEGEPQSVVDGPDQEASGEDTASGSLCECTEPHEGECPQDGGDGAVEEQRSGVDATASAARRRRLQMMGLTLPQ